MVSNSFSSRPFSERRADCCVFVLNFPYGITQGELSDIFTAEVAEVKYIEFFTDEKGTSNGTAVIEFQFPRVVQLAVEKMHRKNVRGRNIVVKSTEDARKSEDFDFYIKTNESQAKPETKRVKCDQSFFDGGNGYEKNSFNSSGNSFEGSFNRGGHSTESFLNDGNPMEGSFNRNVNYFNREGNFSGGSFNRNSSTLADSFNTGQNPREFSLSGRNFSGGSFERGGNTLDFRNDESFLGNSLSVSSQWKYGNTFGLPVEYLITLGIDGPLGRRVHVSFLDQKVTADDLRETFQIAGTVVDAEVMKNKSGQSRGIATVEYEHPLQAVQAISMLNNQWYFNHRISVQMDKFNDIINKVGTSRVPKGLKSIGIGLGVDGEAVKDVSELSKLLQKRIEESHAFGSNMNYIERGGNLPTQTMSNTGMKNVRGMGSYNMGGNLPPQLMSNTGMMGGMRGSNIRGNCPPQPLGNAGMEFAGEMGDFNRAYGFGIISGLSGAGVLNKSGDISDTESQGIEKPEILENMRNHTNSSSEKEGAITIDNVPSQFSKTELKFLLNQLCSKYGDVKLTEIGKKGIGYVRFSSEADARRAAGLLDDRLFYGRKLCVSVDYNA